MSRAYGWAVSSERCYGSVPRNWGKNVTVLTTLKLGGIDIETTVYFEGSLTRSIFEQYLVKILAPHLEWGEIIVLDNLSSHLVSEEVAQSLAKKGCKLLYLPAYSPDLSPIELAFAKIKGYLRAVGARTKAKLVASLEEALAIVTPAEARAFFSHCGYKLAAQ